MSACLSRALLRASGPIVSLRRRLACVGLILAVFAGPALAQDLFVTTKATGELQARNALTGALIAGNVGGIVNGRGLAFYPSKGLYVAHGNAVSRLADSSANSTTTVLSYTAETPHDLTFDAAGNLYVVTDTKVHVYDSLLLPTAAFTHGMTATIGDGNQFKSWAIAIHPSNGEVFVGGAQGVIRFSAGGTPLGSLSAPATFLLGAAGIAFTSSGFNGAFLYVGAVRSGNDFIYVFDAGLNFLRSITLAHNGNPIDMEMHPTTGELLSLNTANDVLDRYSTTEVRTASVVPRSRGLAIGDLGPWLDTPQVLRVGHTYQLDVHASYPAAGLLIALPHFCTATANIAMPPVGTLGLDPSLMIMLPPFVVPQPGVGSLAVQVLNLPTLAGIAIHTQAFVFDQNQIRFTDVNTDVILP